MGYCLSFNFIATSFIYGVEMYFGITFSKYLGQQKLVKMPAFIIQTIMVTLIVNLITTVIVLNFKTIFSLSNDYKEEFIEKSFKFLK